MDKILKEARVPVAADELNQNVEQEEVKEVNKKLDESYDDELGYMFKSMLNE